MWGIWPTRSPWCPQRPRIRRPREARIRVPVPTFFCSLLFLGSPPPKKVQGHLAGGPGQASPTNAGVAAESDPRFVFYACCPERVLSQHFTVRSAVSTLSKGKLAPEANHLFENCHFKNSKTACTRGNRCKPLEAWSALLLARNRGFDSETPGI